MNLQKEKPGKTTVLTIIYLLQVLQKQKFPTKPTFSSVTTTFLPITGPTLLPLLKALLS